MGIQEAVAKSAESLTIYIVKEALFCNVYEESAWRFVELIKPYKPIKKRVKKLNMDVVSIGFPKSQLPAILDIVSQNGFTLSQEEPSSLILKTLSEPDTNFSEWKQNIPLSLLGKTFPGIVEKVEVEPYEYKVPSTGETIMLQHKYRFNPIPNSPTLEETIFSLEVTMAE